MAEYTRTVSVRMPIGVYEKVEAEIEMQREYRTVTEFTLDAVKWYLDYRVNQRIESSKVKTEITRTEEL